MAGCVAVESQHLVAEAESRVAVHICFHVRTVHRNHSGSEDCFAYSCCVQVPEGSSGWVHLEPARTAREWACSRRLRDSPLVDGDTGRWSTGREVAELGEMAVADRNDS